MTIINGAINNGESFTNTVTETGTDTLYRKKKSCKWYGSCRTKYYTDYRNYNPLVIETVVSHASATLSAGGKLTTKGSKLENKGSVGSNDQSVNDKADNNSNELVSLTLDARFSTPSTPDANFLFETNPAFTNYDTFISSDFMLERMGISVDENTNSNSVRIGDGYLEQKLVQDQIIELTGNPNLPLYDDTETLYQALMENALGQHEALALTLGVTLTEAQIALLDEPIVWMVEQTVETANGPVVALAPKVYFPSSMDMLLRADGALIAAGSIDIDVDNDFTNSGAIVAQNALDIDAGLIENSGTLTSGDSLSLNSNTDIINRSGEISATGALTIAAVGDVISETEKRVIVNEGESTKNNDSYKNTQTLVGATASISGGSVSITSGNDITFTGSDLTSTSDINLSAGNDVTLAALEVENSSIDGNHHSQSSIKHQVSNVNGDNINITASNTVTSEGAQVNATGDLNIDATDIDLVAVVDSETSSSFVGGGSNYTKTKSQAENIISSTLSSGAALALNAINDIYSVATNIFAEDNIALAAGGNVTLASQAQTQSEFSETKSKKSGFTGSKTSKTTTSSESIEQMSTSLASNGGIQITTGNDLTLYGSTAQAEGSIDVDAGGDIQLLAAVNQESESYQSEKKGTFKVKTKSSGSVEQTAVVSGFTSNNGDLSVEADGNISTEGATLASTNGTLSLGAGGAGAEAATLDENGNYVNENGDAIGNITLGTKELHNSSWSESSSSLRGGLNKMMTGLTALAAYATGGMSLFIPYEIEVGRSDSTRTDSTIHAVTTVNTNNLDIDAVNDAAFIGTDVTVTDTANIDAKNVTIDAALNTTTHTESHSTQSMSSDGPSLSKETGEATLVSLSEIEQTDTTTTTSNEWQGASFDVGNLNINAEEEVQIIASDIIVKGDANIDAENILIGGREDTYEKTNESTTQTETLSLGVKNVYGDVYLAGRAVDKANESIGDAEDAYNDAKAQVEAGTLSSTDLEFYEYQLDAAKQNLKYALIGLTNASISAATSAAIYGFTATASTSTTSSTNTQTATNGIWNGSTINVGGNASVNSEKDLTLEGSSMAVNGILEANADNIKILAGTNTSRSTSSSEFQGATASASYSGGPAINGSVGVNASSSESSSESTSYTNSSLSGGAFVSNSDSLTLKGGNIYGDSVSINTGELNVISLQDTAKSKSKSEGGGIGINGSYDIGSEKSSIDGGSLSDNQSTTESDYASVNQQSSITTGDGGYQINVTGNTNLVAGLITSNDNAEIEGNNSFSTGTLTQSALENKAGFNGESFGGDISVSKAEDGSYKATKSAGYGETEFSQRSTTESGINTANIVVTDVEAQQALTGESTSQVIANIATDTTTETATVDSGALNNNFDQSEVEEFVNNQQAVTQAFDKNVTTLKGLVGSQLAELKQQLENGEINQEQFNDKAQTLQNYNLVLGTIGALVGTPTNSVIGQIAAAASPTVSYAIGQYFKDLAAGNDNGQLTGGEEAAHVLAHGVLAAAVAAAGGNDGLTAGVTAATSEAAAPLLASWLYGTENGADLTPEQQETIASILGLASTAVGATTGDLGDAVAAGQSSDTAIDNNFLGGESLEALKEAREGRMSIEDARKILELDYINQHSDQLLDKYKTDPDSLSTEEKIKLESYITTFYNEQVEIYGIEDALQITSLLFSDEPKWQDSALDYNFPWALDSEAKDDALSNLDVKWTDYFTLDGVREVSDNEQLNQHANSLLVFNAVQQSQAEMGDLISLATGVGEAAIAARSLIALYT